VCTGIRGPRFVSTDPTTSEARIGRKVVWTVVCDPDSWSTTHADALNRMHRSGTLKALAALETHVTEGYVVAIKRSARRTSAAAGAWVNEAGPRRAFDSKAAAREWAREASAEGRVWVQDALPADASGVDGYLVGGRRPSGSRERSSTDDSQSAIDVF
jgi:hypothetical protein